MAPPTVVPAVPSETRFHEGRDVICLLHSWISNTLGTAWQDRWTDERLKWFSEDDWVKMERKGISAMGQRTMSRQPRKRSYALFSRKRVSGGPTGPTTCLLSLRQKPGSQERALGTVSRGRDRLLCSFLGHQKAEKCESLAPGAWFLEHGLPWAAVCLVTFNRGLFRLILKGGV